jgi:putative FmdB family regulatory protein
MPTYEYRCPNGHDFDHFVQKISEGVATLPCPVCGLPAERRVSGGAGLVFRGSGFYITDYGKDGKKDQRTAGASDTAKPAPAPGGGDAAGTTGSTSGAPPSGPAPSPAPSPAPASGSDAPKPPRGTGKSRTKKDE